MTNKHTYYEWNCKESVSKKQYYVCFKSVLEAQLSIHKLSVVFNHPLLFWQNSQTSAYNHSLQLSTGSVSPHQQLERIYQATSEVGRRGLIRFSSKYSIFSRRTTIVNIMHFIISLYHWPFINLLANVLVTINNSC